MPIRELFLRRAAAPAARVRQTDRNTEGRIVLLVDQHVARRVGAQPMKPDLVGAQGRRVVTDVEERITVGGEHEIGARIVDTLIDGFAVILLISMYVLAGLWGAIAALSAILAFLGLRTKAIAVVDRRRNYSRG